MRWRGSGLRAGAAVGVAALAMALLWWGTRSTTYEASARLLLAAEVGGLVEEACPPRFGADEPREQIPHDPALAELAERPGYTRVWARPALGQGGELRVTAVGSDPTAVASAADAFAVRCHQLLAAREPAAARATLRRAEPPAPMGFSLPTGARAFVMYGGLQLLLGVSLVALVSSRRNGVRDAAALEALGAGPTLAVLPKVHGDTPPPLAPLTEALAAAARRHGVGVVQIVSARRGEGRSTLARWLAAAAAEQSIDVRVVDGPPVRALSERMSADALLFVAADGARRRDVADAVNRLERRGVQVIGSVLNLVDRVE